MITIIKHHDYDYDENESTKIMIITVLIKTMIIITRNDDDYHSSYHNDDDFLRLAHSPPGADHRPTRRLKSLKDKNISAPRLMSGSVSS